MLDFDEVAEVLSDLESLNFFPTTDSGRTAIIKIVGGDGQKPGLASDIEQVRWLVGRMLQLYNNWPGPAEMRALFCKRFKPADGVDTRNTHTSTFFPDGNIPCETPEAPPYQSAAWLLQSGRRDLLLPPGHAVSADVEVENEIRRAVPVVTMDERRRSERAAKLVPVANFKRVTAAELDRAAAEVRAARSAPHDFEDSGVGGLCRICWLTHHAREKTA